jgi:hypothetical protein
VKSGSALKTVIRQFSKRIDVLEGLLATSDLHLQLMRTAKEHAESQLDAMQAFLTPAQRKAWDKRNECPF